MRNLKKKQMIKEGAEEVSEALLKFANLRGFFRKFLLLTLLFLFINVNGNFNTKFNLNSLNKKALSFFQ